jgi:hypothetical protein
MNNQELIWIASFDIGKKNFAFYIEEMNKNQLLNLKNINKSSRYNPNGTCTNIFNELLQKIYLNGSVVLYQNCDLTKNCNNKLTFDYEILHNLTDLLDKYKNYWDYCEAFVIEQQMSFGKQNNTMAIKIAQHCWSYFSFQYSRYKQIISFPAYYKTQILGAQKIEKKTKKGKISYISIDKPARKKWSIEKATNILADREDFETLSNLSSNKKKDDLSDVLCQLQAFKYLVFIDKSL